MFAIEIETCVRCQGRLRVIAGIEEPEVIARCEGQAGKEEGCAGDVGRIERARVRNRPSRRRLSVAAEPLCSVLMRAAGAAARPFRYYSAGARRSA